jgi:hypothetical protein
MSNTEMTLCSWAPRLLGLEPEMCISNEGRKQTGMIKVCGGSIVRRKGEGTRKRKGGLRGSRDGVQIVDWSIIWRRDQHRSIGKPDSPFTTTS